MKTKTILSAFVVLSLCLSVVPLAVSAAGSGADPTHRVDISAEQIEDGSGVNVTVEMVWQYDSDKRNDADEDQDGTVSATEALQFNEDLAVSSLEELQMEYESHIWEFSLGNSDAVGGGASDINWDITATAENLEGDRDDTAIVTIRVVMIGSTSEPVEIAFGPLAAEQGGGFDYPRFETTVEISDTGGYCATSVAKDNGDDLSNPFSWRENETFTAEVTFGKENCAGSHSDADFDGVQDEDDACPGTEIGATVDETGCEISELCDADGDGVEDDADGDHVSDCLDTCANSTGDSVNSNGCTPEQSCVAAGDTWMEASDGVDAHCMDAEDGDGTFNVTFSVDVGDGSNATSYTCTGMSDTSSALDCMMAVGDSGYTVPAGSTVAAGHPHHWSWSLQVNGATLADQNPANLTLVDATSTFGWAATGCTGDCRTTIVHEVTNLSGAVDASPGDCVWFNGVSPTFDDGFDNTMTYRCLSAAGTYTSGDLTITVASATGNGTVDDTTDSLDIADKDESTPGFGLVAGITAVLGAALIAASRRD